MSSILLFTNFALTFSKKFQTILSVWFCWCWCQMEYFGCRLIRDGLGVGACQSRSWIVSLIDLDRLSRSRFHWDGERVAFLKWKRCCLLVTLCVFLLLLLLLILILLLRRCLLGQRQERTGQPKGMGFSFCFYELGLSLGTGSAGRVPRLASSRVFDVARADDKIGSDN